MLALFEDGAPAQARLEAFEAKLFEQAPVVVDRVAPVMVVVGHVAFAGRAPTAARQAVGPLEQRGHGHAPFLAVGMTAFIL
jgi:hypothetical protein